MILSNLLARGEAVADERLDKKIHELAATLRGLFGSSAVTIEAGQVVVAGKGLLKRWLSEPAVRFLSGGLK